MKAIFALLIGVIIGALAQSAAAPDPRKLQNYTSDVSYLTGRVHQSRFEDPILREAMAKAACQIYQENELKNFPSNYTPGKYYTELSSLCQTQ